MTGEKYSPEEIKERDQLVELTEKMKTATPAELLTLTAQYLKGTNNHDKK